jgi:hypothetical protein
MSAYSAAPIDSSVIAVVLSITILTVSQRVLVANEVVSSGRGSRQLSKCKEESDYIAINKRFGHVYSAPPGSLQACKGLYFCLPPFLLQ